MGDEGTLDVGQRDTHPAHLDVTVDPAVEQQGAVAAVAAPVAGAKRTHRLAFVIGEGDEVGLDKLPLFEVAEGQVDAAGMDAARHPERAVFAALVQQPVGIARQRCAVGDALPIVGAYLVPDAPDGGFGRPAEGEEAGGRQAGAQALYDARLDVIPPLGDEPQTLQRVDRVAGEQHLQHGRHRTPEGDAVARDESAPVHRILVGAGLRQHQGGAGGQAAKHVEDRHVVVQRGDGEKPVLLCDAPALQGAADHVGGGLVAQHHALGAPRGT